MSYKTVNNTTLISAFTLVMKEVDFPLKLKMASLSQYQWYELADKMREFCDNDFEIRDLVDEKIRQDNREKIVPVVIASTGELVGTAKILPPKDGKINANITIFNSKLLKEHKGFIRLVLEENQKND